ncbi:MAG: (2Fe-2S)-binding protein [Betaproteobacteria bacterium]|nr:(2Fe-2S)-binding protein [Betaproteobacteria bacterium]
MIPVFGEVGMKSEKITVELRRKSGVLLQMLSLRKGTNLWVALRRFGIPVGSSCSGVGVCGKCAVQIDEQYEKQLSPRTDLETETLSRQGIDPAQRLSCLCRVQGDVIVSADYW